MKYIQLLHKVESAIARLLLAMVVLLVFVAALLRWFHHPLTWSVDLATLIFVWVCFLGADLAVQNDRHIGVTLLPNSLNERARVWLYIVINVACFAFAITLAIFAARLAILNPKRRFPGMNISYSWATGSGAAGLLLIARSLMGRIVGYLPEAFGKGDAR